ncbi:hypothetical protein Bca4012_011609 [Brassica carinata]
MQKLESFQVENKFGRGSSIDYIRTRLTLSAYEALVCLNCSPVLEVLKICLGKYDSVVALRVCSPSLKSFTLKGAEPIYPPRGCSVAINTPKLKCLSLVGYYHFRSFDIISVAESLKVDIDVDFELMSGYYLSDMKIICNFLKNFSGVKDMTMSWQTLEYIYNSSVRRLSELSIVLLPRCLVSSLESVEMESPVTEIATELSLARYFMKKSTTLKRIVLRLNNKSTGEQHEPGVLEQRMKY